MSQQWYYTRGGGTAQMGPVDTDALRQLIASGNVTAQDMVWSEGMTDWRRAGDVPTFFAPAAPQQQQPQYAQQQYGQQQFGQPQYGQPQYGQPQYGQPQYGQPYGGPAPLNYHTPVSQGGYAGFWLRFCAAFVDGIILFIVNFVVGFIIGIALVSSGNRVNPGVNALVQIIGLVIGWLYSALQESSAAQATLGKRAVGIYVTDGRGQRISFGRATGRHFAKFISAIILLIGYIMAGFTDKKQALHDMMADTLVLRR